MRLEASEKLRLLQVVQYREGQHEVVEKLVPKFGMIYVDEEHAKGTIHGACVGPLSL